MKISFKKLIIKLKENSNHFEVIGAEQKLLFLAQLKNCVLPFTKELSAYHDTLLFIRAYPDNSTIKYLAEDELARICKHTRSLNKGQKAKFENTGLPYTKTVTRFTPDFLNWLMQQNEFTVKFDSFYNPKLSLNDVLYLTLSNLLRYETTAGMTNEDLLTHLKIEKTNYLPFIIQQLNNFSHNPLIKDFMMEQLNVYVQLDPKHKLFSRTYNGIAVPKIFYHDELLKQFNHQVLLNSALPLHAKLDSVQKLDLLKSIRFTMALTARETDPSTFMDETSLQLYHLERGLSIAIYDLGNERQLPLESYVGFTLFKNGFPVSYGGSWVFGPRAKFGMNVFDTYRGGESGYVMCQLLRVYKQLFNLTFIEVEPTQYGLENPDGIKSGAFWFYYRYGFRPLDKDLNQLAENEYKKIKAGPGYKSSEITLLRFTESNMALNFRTTIPLSVADITSKVIHHIHNQHGNNSMLAEATAIKAFCKATKITKKEAEALHNATLIDLSLWLACMPLKNKTKFKLMKQMLFEKTKNAMKYQKLLSHFLKPKEVDEHVL